MNLAHSCTYKHDSCRNNDYKTTFCRTRSLSNATFSFLITWRSSSSKSAAMYRISSKSDDFSLRYGDITIFKMAAVRYLRNHRRSLCCWPQLAVKYHLDLIHISEDITIWIIRIFGLKCLFRPPKWGFWETLAPEMWLCIIERPSGTSLRKSASFKLSTVKNPLRGLTCRRVDRKCDGHTHRDRHTQVNLYSVHA